MASNMIVLNSQFNPFSYQDLLAPVQAADTEHKAIQEDEGKLQTLADVWKSRLNQTTDPVAYKRYNDYLTKLQEQSSALATNGLNPASRKNLIDLKSGYSSDIAPIEEAYTNRQKAAAFQNELLAKDNSVVFQQNLGSASIDDFLKNPNLTSKYASGAAVLAQSNNMAKQYADQLLNDPKSGLTKANHGYLMAMTRQGVDPAVLDQVINSSTADSQLKGVALQLKNIRNNAVATTGVHEWGNPEALQKMQQFANQGLYAALGKTDVKYMEDWQAKLKAENDYKNPPTTPNPIADFDLIPKTNVNTNVATSGVYKQMADDLKLVNASIENPDVYNKNGIDLSKRYVVPNLKMQGHFTGMYGDNLKNKLDLLDKTQENIKKGDYSNPTNTGAKENKDRLDNMMKRYGVTTIEDLKKTLDYHISQSANITHNYRITLKNDDLDKSMMNNLHGKISSTTSSTGKSNVWEQNDKGTKSKNTLNLSDVDNIFNDKKSKIDVVIDTDNNRFAISHGGKLYPFDKNIVDPSGTLDSHLQKLNDIKKHLNDPTITRPEFEALNSKYHKIATDASNRFAELLREESKK